jgi:hypothetical protein
MRTITLPLALLREISSELDGQQLCLALAVQQVPSHISFMYIFRFRPFLKFDLGK